MTRHGDDTAWNDFVAWCRKRGLSPMPANPWTVAAYARWCERHHRFPAIMRTIRAIARVHRSKSRKRPDRHPTVARTMRLIENRGRTRTKVKGPGLFPEADIIGGTAKTGTSAAKDGTRKSARGRSRSPARTKRSLSPRPKLVSKRRLKK